MKSQQQGDDAKITREIQRINPNERETANGSITS